MEIVRLVNGLILLAVILAPLERFFGLRKQLALRPGIATDVGYYFLSSLLPNRLLFFPMAALAIGLEFALPSALHLWAAGLPIWVRVPAAVLVAEIGFYWGHRWSHRLPWLWRFHAIHHSPAHMDWLVNSHAHPVDLVFTRACGYIPLYILGLAQGAAHTVDWLPLLIALGGSMWGYFIHANVRFRLGPLEYLIATPAFHHWHHNNLGADHHHMNYAPLLPVIDRLFGTFHLAPEFPPQYGIDEAPEEGILNQLVQPFL
jgi:sterol desaturase/sphingolipid hydroxylase (fatty acid hydroxylase superfamily)